MSPGARIAGLAAEARAYARFARDVPRALREPLTPERARALVAESLRAREERLLGLLDRGVFAFPGRPLARLLAHAGIEAADVRELVRAHGVEGALARLHEEGVHLTVDEYKGRRPIVRGSLSLDATPADFDNPLAAGPALRRVSGSGGPMRRFRLDFGLFEHEAAYEELAAAMFPGVYDRPVGLWRPVPPGSVGLKSALRFAKRRKPVERWFSPNALTPLGGTARDFVLTWTAILAARRAGFRVPTPEHVPLGEAATVARWLAEKAAAGTPAYLSASASSAVRVCAAAREHGLDLSGTWIRAGGEPFTAAKAAALAERGCRVFVNYSMGEVGRIGIACGTPAAPDDVHVAADKVAVLQREQEVGGVRFGALFVTPLHAGAPKLVLNLETGDHAVLEERECGCLLEGLGLSRHVHTIRSYEKLVSEGMNFLASDLVDLLERALPSRFGGSPSDYQLVEEEVDGLPQVTLVVSPRVGPLDERTVGDFALAELGAGAGYRAMMAGVWRQGGTLRVSRREPHAAGAKVQPLHSTRR